jgi:MoxR-like ATPase
MSTVNPLVDLAGAIKAVGGQPSKAASQATQKIVQDAISASNTGTNRFWATDEDKKKIALGIALGKHMFFYGPAGVGKSTTARCILDRSGMSYYRFQGHEGFTSEDWYGTPKLQGGDVVVEYSDLIKAAEEGTPVIVEEINLILPSQMGPLFSFLDDTPWVDVTVGGKTKRVVKKKGFRMLATANDNGSGDQLHLYGGGQLLNKAVASRFPVFIKTGYLPAPMEMDMIMTLTGLADKTLLQGMAEVAAETRKLAQDDASKAEMSISPRNMLDWAKAYMINDDAQAGLTHEGIAQIILANRLPETLQETIMKLVLNKLKMTKLTGLQRVT